MPNKATPKSSRCWPYCMGLCISAYAQLRGHSQISFAAECAMARIPQLRIRVEQRREQGWLRIISCLFPGVCIAPEREWYPASKDPDTQATTGFIRSTGLVRFKGGSRRAPDCASQCQRVKACTYRCACDLTAKLSSKFKQEWPDLTSFSLVLSRGLAVMQAWTLPM